MSLSSIKGRAVLFAALFSLVFLSGCKPSGDANTANTSQPANAGASNTSRAANTTAKAGDDDMIPSGTGVEKEKPEPGKGNVQGKVFYNQQPAAGIRVQLCEKFSRFIGGCSGETFTTKTDDAGEYLIKGVTPKTYEGLLVYVFDTDYYIFATSGFVSAAKYRIEPDKTYFAPDTHLFKQDLKLLSPKAGSKIGPDNIEIKWAAYPDAAYYKLSLHPDSSTGAQTVYDYINRRIDGLSFTLDQPLAPGTYTCKVEAFNSNDIRLAQSPGDIKFTVTK